MQVFGNPFNVIQTKRSNFFVINLEIEKRKSWLMLKI